MRIALINDWFSEAMGYSENCLPKALAALGHDVHMITSDAQPYFNSPMYAETYAPFLGPPLVPVGEKALDGYTLHRLQHQIVFGRFRIRGLTRLLGSLRPDVVHSLEAARPTAIEPALARWRLGYSLFLESHVHASVFDEEAIRRHPSRRLKWALYRKTVGRFVSSQSTRCYAISEDAADIAARWYGIARDKLEVSSLGVDTDLFHGIASQEDVLERDSLRASLRFSERDIVCIYTGRFGEDKGVRTLADAIKILRGQGGAFRALFVGNGSPEEVALLARSVGSSVHPFVPVRELAPFYRAADIGVWPRQESTSQLDAAACGIPIVISDRVRATERIDGNGLSYREGDPADLARQLSILASPDTRVKLGLVGADRMRRSFSWSNIAMARVRAYEEAIP